jgi:hypothetical protein
MSELEMEFNVGKTGHLGEQVLQAFYYEKSKHMKLYG